MYKKMLIYLLIGIVLFFSTHKIFYGDIISSNGDKWLNSIFFGVNPVYFAWCGFTMGYEFKKSFIFPIVASIIFAWSINVLYSTYDGILYVPIYIIVTYFFMIIRKLVHKRILRYRENKRRVYYDEDGQELE